MAKTYRTARGQLVNMEELAMKNEKTIAAGNLGTNAKGDKVRGGRVVQSAAERVAPYHKAKKQVTTGSVRPSPKVDREEPEGKVDGTVKTREDGSQYEEVMMEDGSVEVREVRKSTAKRKKDASI